MEEQMSDRMIGKELITTNRSEHLGQILELYMRGRTQKQISITLDISVQRVGSTLRSFRQDYLSCLASEGFVPRANESVVINSLNKEFYKKLSPSDHNLTEPEMLYCAYFISTGNSLEAIQKAELDIGLDKGNERTKEIYDKNCLLRSELLKRKKNVQEEIRRLQMERLEVIDITKDKLLAMHMEMIDQLREEGDPKNKGYIVKLMDQVAKMQGAYTTVIKTGEISADDVLDGMMQIMNEEMPEELRNTEVTSTGFSDAELEEDKHNG